jgi:hypothetical protein
MAVSHYTRTKTERRLQDFRAKVIEERAGAKMSGVKFFGADELLTRIARDAELKLEPNESSTVENIVPGMDMALLRKHLNEGGVSIDTVNFLIFNLTASIAPRKAADGTFYAVKENDIARVEDLVSKLNRYNAEYSAMKVMQNAKKIAESDPASYGIFALAKGLTAFNQQYDERERHIAMTSRNRVSHALTNSKQKAIRDMIIDEAIENGWGVERFKEELQTRGISGLADGTAVRKFRFAQITNATKNGLHKVGSGLLTGTKYVAGKGGDLGKYVWNNKMQIARTTGKVVTAPIWGIPYLGYKAAKGIVKGGIWVARGIIKAPYQITGTAAAAITSLVGIPVGAVKGILDGIRFSLGASKKVYVGQSEMLNERVEEGAGVRGQ